MLCSSIFSRTSGSVFSVFSIVSKSVGIEGVAQSTILVLLVIGSSAEGGNPPRPMIVKELPPAIRPSCKLQRFCAIKVSASIGTVGSSFKPDSASMSGVSMVISPLNCTPKLEVAVISLSSVCFSLASIPKIP